MDKEYKLTTAQRHFIEYTVTFDIFEKYDSKFRSLYPDGYLSAILERKTYFESDRYILNDMRKDCIELATEHRWKQLLRIQKEQLDGKASV